MEDYFIKIGWVRMISVLMHFWKCVNKTEGKLAWCFMKRKLPEEGIVKLLIH